MKWDLTDVSYPQIDLMADHVDGLSLWIEKIAEMAVEYGGEWNTLVADLWPNDNYSRLIGHVQMNDVEIGYDTGFRVCAYLKNGGIKGDSGDDMPLIKDWLTSSVEKLATKTVLNRLFDTNEFDIRLSCWGDGDLGDAIRIEFYKG
jgi:hypothetical protein